MHRLSRDFAIGLFWAVLAVSIWSGSLVMLRLGVTTTLNAYDLTAIRFGVAAALLLPVVFNRGYTSVRLKPIVRLAMVCGFGAPYIVLISFGLTYAPASAAGAINPGLMAVFVVLVSAWCFGNRLSWGRVVGIIFILGGVVLFVRIDKLDEALIGYVIFAFTAAMWAVYALLVRHAGVPALQATVIIAIGSATLYLPIYFIAIPKNLFDAPIIDILVQTVFQGVLVSIVAVYAFNRSSECLGPITGATLPALIPIVTLGLDVIVLGETASPQTVVAAISIGIGVSLTLFRSKTNHIELNNGDTL